MTTQLPLHWALLAGLSLLLAALQAPAGPLAASPSADQVAAPTELQRLLALGHAAIGKREFAKADEAFRAASAADPKSVEPWLGMAETARVSGQAKAIEPALNKARQIAPKSVAVLSAWASWHYANGRFDAAEASWRSALTEDPKAVGVLVDLGDFEFNVRQRPAQAAALYEKALQIDPSRAGAWHALGTAHLALGKAQPALTHMRKAVELSPGNPLALTGLARAHFALGQRDEALQQYERALVASPRFAPARLERAELLRLSGKPAEAVQALQPLVQEQPKLLAAQLGLALAWQAQGKSKEALQAYQAALAVDGGNLQALNNAAWLASDRALGVPDQGLAWAKKAATLRPADPLVIGTLAWVEFQRGDRAGATKRLRALVAASGAQRAESHYLLGRVLSESGDVPAARASLQKALQLDPKFAFAAETQQLLESLR